MTSSSSADSSSSLLQETPGPVFSRGRFSNPWESWNTSNFSLRRLISFFCTRSQSNIPSDEVELDKVLPIHRPDFSQPKDNSLKVTWLGHATVLVQSEFTNILTDPIWANRCSPVPCYGPLRYRPPPCKIEELPKINAVVISHNHHDHLDICSVRDIRASQHELFDGHRPMWFVPLGIKQFFRKLGFENDEVREMTWWEENYIQDDLPSGAVRITCLPCQHWSCRSPFVKNKTLWSSWAVSFGRKKFYYAGDTGYCPAFSVIGEKYGPFDVAAIPIGCYEPKWFMQNHHIGPDEAVEIHKDVRAKASIAVHWGTYKMNSTEFYLEPRSKLVEEVAKAGLSAEAFIAPNHGQTLVF